LRPVLFRLTWGLTTQCISTALRPDRPGQGKGQGRQRKVIPPFPKRARYNGETAPV
jgi:hypothetical protein